MKRNWVIGWISAAIAVVAVLILLVDIVRTQSAKRIAARAPTTTTIDAARAAGASVAPTDPKLAPGNK